MIFEEIKNICIDFLKIQHPYLVLNKENYNKIHLDKYIRKVLKISSANPESSIIKIVNEILTSHEYEIYKDYYEIESSLSPLRYPGAKSKVLKKFSKYFKVDHLEYREPFVGGGSIFLGKHVVKKNILNDKDFFVYNFLITVRDKPNSICKLILETHPTVQLWLKKKNDLSESLTDVELAFNFLFFNRTNYSGIFSANPIGGLNQTSQYKIDCRWNSQKLCEKIMKMSAKLKNTKITNFNFEEIISLPGENVFMIIDPPYFEKGNSLYPIKMSVDDHLKLSETLKKTPHKYLLTIDDCKETREIYLGKHTFLNQESWKYTIHSKKVDNVGKEMFISNFQII